VEELSFPYLDHLVPTYNVLSNAEASSNLSRYDGIRYGYRSGNASDIDTTYSKSRSEGFGPEVKRRIMLGTFVLSAGYYDAYYAKAQKVRNLIRTQTIDVLSDFDFILSPTTPHSAFNIGEILDPVQMYLEDIFTVQANLAGVPSVSMPVFESDEGMPVGLQITTGPFEEKKLMQFARSFED
jgi:aspartyl-tRNA(Asn)/glutamyl-tRNA(Gln) amidotransferase subunit A